MFRKILKEFLCLFILGLGFFFGMLNEISIIGRFSSFSGVGDNFAQMFWQATGFDEMSVE